MVHRGAMENISRLINDYCQMDNGMTITEERRVLTWSLHNLPEIYHLFQWNKREWMAQ